MLSSRILSSLDSAAGQRLCPIAPFRSCQLSPSKSVLVRNTMLKVSHECRRACVLKAAVEHIRVHTYMFMSHWQDKPQGAYFTAVTLSACAAPSPPWLVSNRRIRLSCALKSSPSPCRQLSPRSYSSAWPWCHKARLRQPKRTSTSHMGTTLRLTPCLQSTIQTRPAPLCGCASSSSCATWIMHPAISWRCCCCECDSNSSSLDKICMDSAGILCL